MTSFENKVKKEYFEWLCDLISEGRVNENISYNKLFIFLHSIEFTFTIRSDINRAKDGVDLRYRFTTAMGYDSEQFIDILDGPCTVLEMMIALAIRCETIMDNTKYGDRTGQWFWNMISNLGINSYTDDRFNYREVEGKIYRFLNRDYDPDGRGGLFYIRGCIDDLREVDIWSQLCWYSDKFD